MGHPRKRRSQSNLARGIVAFGAVLESLLLLSPLIGVLAVSIGVTGMLFCDVQKEHTDRLLGRLEDLIGDQSPKSTDGVARRRQPQG